MIKFKWTLYRKIQIIIMVVLVILFVTSQITVTRLMTGSIQAVFAKNVENTTSSLRTNIEVVFDDARNSLIFIQNQYKNIERDDEYISENLSILNSTKDYISNAFVTYNDGSYVLDPPVLLENYDPREREWYKSAYESRKVQWSEPYIDKVTSELVITGSLYIESKDANNDGIADVDGVVGLDIKLKDIPEIIDDTTVGENGFVLLMLDNIDNENIIIMDSKNEYVGENLTILNDPELSKSGIISGRIKTEKGIYFLKSLKQTNLRILAFLPNQDIKDEINDTLYIFSIVLVVALFVGIIISYFYSKKITKPIEGLTNIMLESSNVDKLLIYDNKTNDEINTLIQGYNTMASNVNQKSDELQTKSEELRVSEQKLHEQYKKVAELAYFDYLTSLPNRLSFEQKVKIMINDKIKFAIYYIDLDNFKYINDTYGHNYGDFVLQIISTRFKKCCDGKYFAARLSGDEFGVIVTFDQEDELDDIATKILDMINDSIFYKDLEFIVTGSIGISLYPSDGKSFEDLLSNADIAMYEAKGKSKNQYKIFNHELRNELINRVNIETNLKNSLDNDEIYLCYQPLIDFMGGKIAGFEALARWNSKELGQVYPDVFIPIAEHNLFINELGSFVLDEAIQFGNRLYDTFNQYYEINVNVSLIQLHMENFVDEVLAVMKKHNYPPQYLNLEITESVALESDEKIHQKLIALRRSGIKLSLDDFGTGYSSLNNLLNFQLTHLKIDRTVIVQAIEDKEVYQLIQGIVQFAHAIGLKVVAEGVEDKHMEEIMEKMDVDIVQGYLYSKPITGDDLIKYLEKTKSY